MSGPVAASPTSTSPIETWNRRVVACANNKGGVKKTSTVVNVGGQLAAAGFRVLIVALDTQHENAATDLGYLDRSDHGVSLAAQMTTGTEPAIVVTDVRPRLDVIADGPALEQVVAFHYGRVGRGECAYETAFALLRPVLAPIAKRYDLILIDCPPGNRVLVDAAMGAARWVLIPTATDRGSIQSMRGTAEAFVAARTHNPTLHLLGVLLTGSGTQATVARSTARAAIDADFGGHAPLLTSFIRHAEAPASAGRAKGMLMHELEKYEVETKTSQPWWKSLRSPQTTVAPRRGWSTDSAGLAEDYHRVTQEIVERIQTAEQADREQPGAGSRGPA